jgi:hypothetical protein
MLQKLNYTVPKSLLQESRKEPISEEFRYSLNQQTGRFFYDPWIIKPEFKDTVWNTILETLPINIGEARLINLKPGNCYQCHSDIDDRYHLNIMGENAYLIDLDNNILHPLKQDYTWYEMDTGRIHSAANFGRVERLQLVVRKLLIENILDNPLKVRLTSTLENKDKARFIFDQTISNYLNYANKNKKISNFTHNIQIVEFDIEATELDDLKARLSDGFVIEIL